MGFQSIEYSRSGLKSTFHVFHVLQVSVGVKYVLDVASPENKIVVCVEKL